MDFKRISDLPKSKDINLERLKKAAKDADWKEGEHKRADNGQFGSGGETIRSKAEKQSQELQKQVNSKQKSTSELSPHQEKNQQFKRAIEQKIKSGGVFSEEEIQEAVEAGINESVIRQLSSANEKMNTSNEAHKAEQSKTQLKTTQKTIEAINDIKDLKTLEGVIEEMADKFGWDVDEDFYPDNLDDARDYLQAVIEDFDWDNEEDASIMRDISERLIKESHKGVEEALDSLSDDELDELLEDDEE